MKRLVLCLAAATLAAPAFGGPEADAPPPKASPTSAPAKPQAKPTPRDPFKTPPAIRRAADSPTERVGQPAKQVAPLPKLRVRGVLVLKGGKAGALLDVEGTTVMVRVGDRLPATPDARPWTVKTIGKQGVVVAAGELTQAVR